MKFICWLKTILKSVKTGHPFNYPIIGHTLNTDKEYKNVTVIISKCKDCGTKTITWER